MMASFKRVCNPVMKIDCSNFYVLTCVDSSTDICSRVFPSL